MNNKNAILRYDVIDECLTDRKGYTISELVEACNLRYSQMKGCEKMSVKSRQVLFDMDNMKEMYRVEIDSVRDLKDRRVVRFSYRPGSRNIHGDRLLDSDYDYMNQAIMMLNTITGIPYITKAIEAIKKRLGSDSDVPQVVSMESNEGLWNFDQINRFYSHIRRCEPLRVRYMASFVNEMEILFQPYYLKQYNGRWYVFGWNYNARNDSGTYGALWNLAIDRIKDKRVDKSRFSAQNPPRVNDVDFSTYFDDIIGVSKYKDSKVEHIVIHVNNDYDWFKILSKPLHHSQTVIEEERKVSIDVRPNYELYTLLLQFEHIEVLSPESVRSDFLNRVATIQDQYK